MLSNNLKTIRESKNMSQEFVAKTLNISRQAISRWENNRSIPDTENLVALSKLYNVSIEELIGERSANVIALNSSEKNQEITKDDTIKMLLYLAILIISTFISLVGIVVSLAFLVKLRKQNHSKIFAVLCILCLIISALNLFVALNGYFFHIGVVTIQ